MSEWPSATWQWLWCFIGLLIALMLAIYDPSPAVVDDVAMLSGALLITANSVDIRRIHVLLLAGSIGAIFGAVGLPDITRPLVAGFLVLVLAFFAILRWYNPYDNKKAKAGLAYEVAGHVRTIPMLEFVGPPPPLIKSQILDDLVSLAEYADRFLTRHGIRYFMTHGTLLGALRHDGLIPWDDDIDLAIFRSEDLELLRNDFDRLAADAARDGYVLFRHAKYYKLAKNNFWRYPVVDLFRREGHLQGVEPERVAFEHVELNVPPDWRARIAKHYGEQALTQAFHSIPFWDSGFVPAFFTRLFGIHAILAAGRLYRALYVVYET